MYLNDDKQSNEGLVMDLLKKIDERLGELFKEENHAKFARITLVFFFLTLLLPIILTKIPISIFDFSETGQIGDTIGGITAPFIGFIAGVLTFMAFHEQHRANKVSEEDLKKERFENKFYNFLSLLNNLEINTKVPKVGNYKQAFHYMFYEYKSIAVLIYRKLGMPDLNSKTVYVDDDGNQSTLTMREFILNQAFGIFLNGVSTSSTDRLGEYLTGKENYNDYFLWLQIYFGKKEHPSVPYLDDYNTIDIKLFDGHRLRLISFFRIICKILELIYDDGGKKTELYLSTLLSLLSEHQMALLKLIYIYDHKEHDRFILTHKKEINEFFTKEFNIENPTVCINKYIYTKTMDCSNKEFINYKKGNSVGSFD